MQLKILTTTAEMIAQIEVIKFLYPNMTIERYESFLNDMVPKEYKQVAVFNDETCVGLSGFWFGTKLVAEMAASIKSEQSSPSLSGSTKLNNESAS